MKCENEELSKDEANDIGKAVYFQLMETEKYCKKKAWKIANRAIAAIHEEIAKE